MEVKYYGFSLNTKNNKITLEDFFSHLTSIGEISDKSKSNERIFYIDDSSEYYKGLVVTVKNQKVFCKYKQKRSGLVIEVENLKKGSKIMDFNFFVVNKKNGMGLYQHYFQSCSSNLLGTYLKSFYFSYRKQLIDKGIEDAEKNKGKNLTKKEEKSIRMKYNDVLEYAMLVKAGNIDSVIESYKKAKSFEYEFAYLTQDISDATPLSKFMQRKKEKIFFKPMNSMRELGSAVKNFVDTSLFRRGRITLENADGKEETIKVTDIPDCFYSEDYDSLASKLDGLEAKTFYSHSYIDELIEICESDEYKHIFLADVKDE